MPASNPLEQFATHFENLTDPRMERTRRHVLQDILVIALCAMIANANTWVDIERFGKAKLDFLRRFLELPNGIPSHDTFGRVFARLDPAALLLCLQNWLADLRAQLGGQHVAIDGKTLRGSHDGATRPNALHLVSAWAAEARLFLGQVAVAEKSNEITAIPQLLELLDIEGDIVTIDAMGCQKEIAKTIVDKGADYVLAVKDNQPTLHTAIHEAFLRFAEDDYSEPSLRRLQDHRPRPRPHGDPRVFHCRRARGPAGGRGLDRVAEHRHGAADPRQEGDTSFGGGRLLHRQHRRRRSSTSPASCVATGALKPRLHWSLDVTFSEDQSRVRKDRGPENLGMLRRLVGVDFAAGHFLQSQPTRQAPDRRLGRRGSAQDPRGFFWGLRCDCLGSFSVC